MADDEKKSSKKDGLEGAVEAIFILLILASITGAVLDYLSENRILKVISSGGPFAKVLPIDARGVLIGREVVSNAQTDVFGSAGGGSIGEINRGESGRITGGPEMWSGAKRWFVSFQSGVRGFVDGDNLSRGNRPISDTRSGIGSDIFVGAPSAFVFINSPGGSAKFTAVEGSRGKIVKGPRVLEDERYWLIEFENGALGFVAESDLKTEEGEMLQDFGRPVGEKIAVKGDISVHQTPGGDVSGRQMKDSPGVIVGPAQFAADARWWPTDFESGSDGWVLEKNLGVPNETFFPFLLRLIKIFSILLTLFLLTTLVYSALRTASLRGAEAHKYSVDRPKAMPREDLVDPRWQRIVLHLDSENPADWRLAILEADIVLGDMLDKMGYMGATIGEKLKTVEESDFGTINQAWEAHKVRNQIAHEGSDFLITQREARRIISLYRQVFEEFHMKIRV